LNFASHFIMNFYFFDNQIVEAAISRYRKFLNAIFH
jgi:hypothetical protein